MSVHFEVSCGDTLPGQALFVVGSVPELGNWDALQGLRLFTNAQCFPNWESLRPIVLPPNTEIVYKFVVQNEDRVGDSRWEDEIANRTLLVEPRTKISINTKWEDANEVITIEAQALAQAPAESASSECQAVQLGSGGEELGQLESSALKLKSVPTPATSKSISRDSSQGGIGLGHFLCTKSDPAANSSEDSHRVANPYSKSKSKDTSQPCEKSAPSPTLSISTIQALSLLRRGGYASTSMPKEFSRQEARVIQDTKVDAQEPSEAKTGNTERVHQMTTTTLSSDSNEMTSSSRHPKLHGQPKSQRMETLNRFSHEVARMTTSLETAESVKSSMQDEASTAGGESQGVMTQTSQSNMQDSGQSGRFEAAQRASGGFEAAQKAHGGEPDLSQSLAETSHDSQFPMDQRKNFSSSQFPTEDEPMKQVSSFSALSSMGSTEDREELRRSNQDFSTSRGAKFISRHLDVPIVIVTSEIDPWSKTGGLALVSASYAYEFAARGHRTMVVTPMYDDFKNTSFVKSVDIWLCGRQNTIEYFHQYKEFAAGCGCDYVFVNHPSYRQRGGIYSDAETGVEYDDNLFRFALLSLAALEAPLVLSLNEKGLYGQRITFLANDWQSGLVPLYLRYKYRRNGTYRDARVLYIVHNLGYQGIYSMARFPPCQTLGIDWPESHCDLTFQGELNLCKGAIINSDRVLTVSPNYAVEITTPAGGFNLQGIVQEKAKCGRLDGILNGVDDGWDPRIDPNIIFKFSADNFQDGKQRCKEDLQKSLDLEVDASLPVIGFVGRLTGQKGIDIIGHVIPWLMHDTGNGVTGHVQLIMMGNGDRQYRDMLRDAERRHPGRVCGYVGFSAKVEHQMISGCDFLLMPSRYEPCGLPQMHSQLYGTLPIVSETGGLKDSVKSIDDVGLENATGFMFQPLTGDRLKQELWRALDLFHRSRDDFCQMQINAMKSDFYWPQAMDEYEKIIDQTIDEPTHRD